jgi:transcriptional regulator with XRE-family HTH domain
MKNGISLKLLRLKLDITQLDLSHYLGFSRAHLNMVERNHRRMPPAVQDRVIWTEQQLEKNLRDFDKLKDKQVLTNELSQLFALKEIENSEFDLKTAEMELEVLLRENVEFTRRVYLFENLEPMQGINKKTMDVFTAWKAYHARNTAQKREKAGPTIILRQKLKIAALKAQLECLRNHIS